MADEILIVGAGLTGCTMAERLAAAGRRVWLIDQRAHLGGTAYDEYDHAGILVHRYGPHIFHTNSPEVFGYLSRFTTWRPYEHRVRASVDGQLVPVPINATTLAMLDCDRAEAYRRIFEPYTRKMWGPAGVDRSVWGRVPPRETDDDRYFTDRYQVMPSAGYTALVTRMLASPLIRVSLSTSWAQVRPIWPTSAPLVYTGPIDAYFDHVDGRLPYRATRLEWETRPVERVQPVACLNYPSEDVPYTRVTEFKHLTGQVHAHTTLAYEFPSASGHPTHPVPGDANHALYRQYVARARATAPQVTFAGRLGTYKYLDMDQCVAQALKLASTLVEGVTA